MTDKIYSLHWVRRDRATGKTSQVTEDVVRVKIEGYYQDIDLALSHASFDSPISTGYADYWPDND